MKPHTLILLLPGLVMSKSWKALLGFAGGAATILGGSLLLGGVQGVWSSIRMAYRFAASLIQTAPTMMNFRGLALNLELVLPDWLAWAVAIWGMILVVVLSLYLWLRCFSETAPRFILLILATLGTTFAVTWHSHFYLLMLFIPILLFRSMASWPSPQHPAETPRWLRTRPGKRSSTLAHRYFAELGLFSPVAAHVSACQSSRR